MHFILSVCVLPPNGIPSDVLQAFVARVSEHRNGKYTREEFLELPLWFEDDSAWLAERVDKITFVERVVEDVRAKPEPCEPPPPVLSTESKETELESESESSHSDSKKGRKHKKDRKSSLEEMPFPTPKVSPELASASSEEQPLELKHECVAVHEEIQLSPPEEGIDLFVARWKNALFEFLLFLTELSEAAIPRGNKTTSETSLLPDTRQSQLSLQHASQLPLDDGKETLDPLHEANVRYLLPYLCLSPSAEEGFDKAVKVQRSLKRVDTELLLHRFELPLPPQHPYSHQLLVERKTLKPLYEKCTVNLKKNSKSFYLSIVDLVKGTELEQKCNIYKKFSPRDFLANH
jgi:hypothetical protein